MPRTAATIDLTPWPYAEHPRVLIEHADPDSSLELAAALRQAGVTVAICRGPDAAADPALRCPLHRLEPCVVVDGADAVVTALDLGSNDGREVLRGLRTRYPATPLIVGATTAESLELADLLDDCTVVPVDAAPEVVTSAVLAALSA